MLKDNGTLIKEICDKYKFTTRYAGFNDNFYCEVYSKNTDGEDTLWFDIQLSDHDSADGKLFEPKLRIYGNTDQNNIWLSDTRKDLSLENVIDFCKNISSICNCKLVTKSTDKENEIYIHSLVDLEDLQEMESDEKIEEAFKRLETHNKMVEKLFKSDFYIWKNYLKGKNDTISDKELLEDIKNNFKNGLFGIEDEIDKLLIEFDEGDKDNPYYEDLDTLWDCFNWYKDYLQNNKMDEYDLFDLVDHYLYGYDEPIEIDSIEK